MAPLISDDYRDYLPDGSRPHWTNRKGAPITLSTAAGGAGLIAGLALGWLTDLREAPPAIIGGLVGMFAFDFYWRHMRDTLPNQRRTKRVANSK